MVAREGGGGGTMMDELVLLGEPEVLLLVSDRLSIASLMSSRSNYIHT